MAFNHGLLLHQRTASQVDLFLRHPSHALLIVGSTGSGKPALARATAANLLQIDEVKLPNYPYYLRLEVPEGKQEIPIEDVRELIEKIKLKTPGKNDVRRVVVIEDAHQMSTEGQNALLKTLEEPGLDTVFILTSPSAQRLAPTIVSRSQVITVTPATLASAEDYYGASFERPNIDSNWLLSGGAAGLLDALLKEDSEHALKTAVAAFKEFLGKDTYGWLLDADKLGKDKNQLTSFLDAGARVLRALQQGAVKSGQPGRQTSLSNARKLISSLQTELQANANPRLVAMALALNLKL